MPTKELLNKLSSEQQTDFFCFNSFVLAPINNFSVGAVEKCLIHDQKIICLAADDAEHGLSLCFHSHLLSEKSLL